MQNTPETSPETEGLKARMSRVEQKLYSVFDSVITELEEIVELVECDLDAGAEARGAMLQMIAALRAAERALRLALPTAPATTPSPYPALMRAQEPRHEIEAALRLVERCLDAYAN